ncbi:glycerate kinase [Nocardioides sp. SYSU DS0663]|uniref:glycerate kinase n=1 Tax=Nocardioides sp. SYSU DS0663 TaxID=3416445 RepID=UPI003F4CA64E
MRILIASDKFKGSLSAAQVADALAAGIASTAPGATVTRVPVADGGDGTLLAALEAGFERVPETVAGPTGETVRTAYARRGDTAVVELADASGLARLGSGLRPLEATTLGTGQLVAAAVDAGCREVVLGLGGSSSTDGGAGLLTGLGARILDDRGQPVPPGGIGLTRAARLETGGPRGRLADVRVVLACDVDNPLLGPSGAAAVYAPQKGASPEQVAALEEALAHWAGVVERETGRDARDVPGAGAAGGAGFAALAVLGAERRSGVETMLRLVDFDAALAGADLVVTGEGSLDEQSLHGKAPVGVLAAARRQGVPVVAVCGRTALDPDRLRATGFAATWALTAREPDVARCVADAADLLGEVGAELGSWAMAAAG